MGSSWEWINSQSCLHASFFVMSGIARYCISTTAIGGKHGFGFAYLAQRTVEPSAGIGGMYCPHRVGETRTSIHADNQHIRNPSVFWLLNVVIQSIALSFAMMDKLSIAR